jgi:hypothetical protein
MRWILQAFNPLVPAVVALVVAAPTNGPPTSPGVRFNVDTTETKSPAAGLFSMFSGRIEFAAGRGRIDLVAMALQPTRSVNDVTIGPPLARSGDYYLFDSTGYILVRPPSRTFSTVSFSALTYRHGDVREPWDGFFECGAVRPEDILPSDTLRLRQHGPFSVRWHLDRPKVAGPPEILARGRVLVADAPRGEASVARWMAVTMALATLRDSISPRGSDLQLTAVAVLPPQSTPSPETNLILLHPMFGIADTEIDVTRLVLPAGYTETPWPGFEHASNVPAPSSETAKRWRTIPARDAPRRTPPNDR